MGLPLVVLAGLGPALLLFSGDDGAPRPASSIPGSSSRIALDVNLGNDADAFASVPGTRPASDIGPEADLCDGVVGAAVVLRTAADEPLPRCGGLVTIADGTVSARALAERGGKGKRRCVNADQASSIAATRRDARRTAARQRAVRRGIAKSRRQTRGAGLTASERVGTLAEAAFDAGRAYDVRNGVRLYAVRKRAGTKCIVPGRDDVAAGRYPLAHADRAADDGAQREAAVGPARGGRDRQHHEPPGADRRDDPAPRALSAAARRRGASGRAAAGG